MTNASAIASLGALAGALGLDTTAALQVMVSEPLVAGTLAGIVVGDPALGIVVGAALQLVWVGALPVGAAPFPDAAPATVAGVGGAFLLSRAGVLPGVAVASAMLAALGAGVVGQRATVWLRRRNEGLAAMAERRAARGDPGGVRAAVALGVGTRFALSGALAVTVMAALSIASRPLSGLSARGEFSPMFWAAPVGACAMVLAARGNLERLLLGAGFAAGLALVAAT